MATMLSMLMLLTWSVMAAVTNAMVPAGSCSCMPDQFQTGYIRLNQINEPVHEFIQYAIDFTEEKAAFLTFTQDTTVSPFVVTPISRKVLDFSAAVETSYVIDSAGTCTSQPDTAKPFQCVPASATHIASTYIGFYVGGMPIDVYKLPIQGTNSINTIAFQTQELLTGDRICVPVVQSIADTSSTSDGSVFVFSEFRPYIDDLSWFEVPSGC